MSIADRQARIATLRRRGMSIREIADATGIPRSTVGRLVQEVEAGCLAPDGTARGTNGTAGTLNGGTNGTPVVNPAAVLVEAQALADVDPEAVPVDGPPPSQAELSDKARRVLGVALDRLLVTVPGVCPRDLNRTVEVTARVAAMFREQPAADAKPDELAKRSPEEMAEDLVADLEAAAGSLGLALVPVDRGAADAP